VRIVAVDHEGHTQIGHSREFGQRIATGYQDTGLGSNRFQRLPSPTLIGPQLKVPAGGAGSGRTAAGL
jgi:hypothetical protein